MSDVHLAIPQSAYDAFTEAQGTDTPQLSIEAIAAPVVAAELRRLVGDRELGGISFRDLRARADELDPPAGRQET